MVVHEQHEQHRLVASDTRHGIMVSAAVYAVPAASAVCRLVRPPENAQTPTNPLADSGSSDAPVRRSRFHTRTFQRARIRRGRTNGRNEGDVPRENASGQ